MPRGKKSISAEEVISLIPDQILDSFADETGVDYSVQKLHGKTVFKLFLFAFLNSRKISLRILEEIFKSQKFKQLFSIKPKNIKHSSLGMRLKTIDYRYFERIFTYLISSPKLESIFFADKKIIARKIDSTLVTISAKLISFGMENRRWEKKNIKYSLELASGVPVNLLLFTEQSAISEDIALPALIKQKPKNNKVHIAIFDRGVQKKKTFTLLKDEDIYFICRTDKHKFKVIEDLEVKDVETKTLFIISDQMVQFSCRKTENRSITLPQKFRLIVGKSKDTKQLISFITNVEFLSATEVTDLYKSRWEIETFFKFIKQELNFSHILSRTENGIKSVMFMTMITAILLTIYKKMNGIKSWAITKIRFIDELEYQILKQWHDEMTTAFTSSKSNVVPDSS